ncbi:MAG: hypothetical protein M3O20_01265 [Acidobacteriota bacterium]|nr:hypothetical protein [Acidobacteriota bacterium]
MAGLITRWPIALEEFPLREFSSSSDIEKQQPKEASEGQAGGSRLGHEFDLHGRADSVARIRGNFEQLKLGNNRKARAKYVGIPKSAQMNRKGRAQFKRKIAHQRARQIRRAKTEPIRSNAPTHVSTEIFEFKS